MTRTSDFLVSVLLICFSSVAVADDARKPRPIPLKRPEMKKYLEDMKVRTPRIPLPELTDEERATLGERASGYEARIRALYATGMNGPGGPRPATAEAARTATGASSTANAPSGAGGFGQANEPGMTLDYRFKTELFWIVSRTNNCQYCLGHQESKLLSTGMEEDSIAALDGDWSEFTPAERAAFAFTRRLTLTPQLVGDADIAKLREHYSEPQILEIILSISGNNSINRWKEGVGVPQSSTGGNFGRRGGDAAAETKAESHSYLTATSDKYSNRVTLVAPLAQQVGELSATVFDRAALESRDEVEKALAAAAARTPRLPLVTEQQARDALADDAPADDLAQWVKLVMTFPQAGKRFVATTNSANEKGDLAPLLKSQASWVIARQDRAWYATAEAKRNLTTLGQSDDAIYALDGSWDHLAARDKALLTVARNLATSPVTLTDAEVAAAIATAGPRDVVQMITFTTSRCNFNRVTEAAGLTAGK